MRRHEEYGAQCLSAGAAASHNRDLDQDPCQEGEGGRETTHAYMGYTRQGGLGQQIRLKGGMEAGFEMALQDLSTAPDPTDTPAVTASSPPPQTSSEAARWAYGTRAKLPRSTALLLLAASALRACDRRRRALQEEQRPAGIEVLGVGPPAPHAVHHPPARVRRDPPLLVLSGEQVDRPFEVPVLAVRTLEQGRNVPSCLAASSA